MSSAANRGTVTIPRHPSHCQGAGAISEGLIAAGWSEPRPLDTHRRQPRKSKY